MAALVAELEVDPETGAIVVRRVVGAYDVGTPLNPTGATGQLEGGLIQGLGYALMEEIRLTNGHVETVGLEEYKLPNIADVPPLRQILLTDAPGVGPYGAKSIGELSNLLLPAAISNAVYDAVGVRITELPITAEKVYSALRARKPQGDQADRSAVGERRYGIVS
jgi:CO/xanthine dehydrogenase Mo-binding subunit